MTSGLESLVEAAAIQKARQSASSNFQFAKFIQNHTHTVRFLEQGDDVAWAWVHELPKEQGKIVARHTPCLNQDSRGQACPGCEMGAKRTIKGWINVIMRGAPVFERGADGKILKNPLTQAMNVTGYADQVYVWNSGPNVFTTLGQKDRKFKGLMSRDFDVTRSGEGFGTTYSIEPTEADGGPKAMSDADLKLAADKVDTKTFTIPESYDTAKQLLQGVPFSAIVRNVEPVATGLNVFEAALANG